MCQKLPKKYWLLQWYAGIKAGLFGTPRPVLLSDKRAGVRDTIKRKTCNSVLLPGETRLFYLMFADDITLLSSTPVGLQN